MRSSLRCFLRPILCLILFLWAAAVGQAAVVIITQGTDPNGYIIVSAPANTGDVFTSQTAPVNFDAYQFAYWKLNGVRQADALGRAVNPVKFTVADNTTLIAVYVQTTLDSDSDGLLDVYEYEFYWDLTKSASSDTDLDGFSLLVESLFGFDPLVFNTIAEGGISMRSTENVALNLNDAYYTVTAVSDPEGLFFPVVQFVTGTAFVTLPTPADSIDGMKFSGWYSGGARADAPTTVQPASVQVSAGKTFTAKYVLESVDSDLDALPDWYEWFAFSGLASNSDSDPDTDGLTVAVEKLFGFAPYLTDVFSEGGISSRDSAKAQINLNNYFGLTLRSNPEGFVEESVSLNAPGSSKETPDLFGSNINGYRFVGWQLDGQRVVDSTGAAAGKATVTMNADRVAVAQYVLDSVDSDADGIPDWQELLYTGVLAANKLTDADLDGLDFGTELLFGMHPGLRDTFSEGGLSQRPTENTYVIFEWMPDITEQPSSIDAPTGSTVTMRVLASWSGVLNYQWRKNGVDIAGATSASLVISNVKASDSAKYDVAVYNPGVRVMSSPAILSVDGQTNGPFVVTNPSDSRNLLQGGSVSLSVIGALGSGTWGYQWVKDGVEIPSATQSVYSVSSMQPWNTGEYTVRVKKTVNTSVAEAVPDSAYLALKGADTSIWSGLQAYYKFDGDANDSSPFQIHGSVRTGSSFGADHRSTDAGLASLKVAGGGVTLPDSPLLVKTRSISIWAKLESLAAGRIIMRGDARTGLDPWDLTVDAAGYPSFANTLLGGGTVTAASPLKVGAWTHLAGTYDDANGRLVLYVNGVNAGEKTGVTSTDVSLEAASDPGWGIGNHSGATQKTINTPFSGSIDDTRIYSRTLSGQEVTQIYETEVALALPVITVQPAGATVNLNEGYTFTVTATGAGLSYQWYQDGSSVVGGTNARLEIRSVSADNAGVYTVKVTNKAGSVTSAGATLSVVNPFPVITSQITGGSVLWGSSFTFSVTASGTAPLSYQWHRNGRDLASGTSSSYVVKAAKIADAGNYDVTVRNAFGTATSYPASLVVTYLPPKNIYVSPSGNDKTGSGLQSLPFATIQKAIDAASLGDVINVLAGTYKGEGNQDLNFRGKNVKLIGVDGPSKTFVDCGQKMIFTLEDGEGPDALVQGFTFFNAYKTDPYDWSAAVLVRIKNSSPTIQDCIFRDSAADGTFWTGTTAAGLILTEGGETSVRNCLVYKNRFKSGDNSTFSSIFSGHFKVIENCTVSDNTLDAQMINWWFFIKKSLLRVFNTDASSRVVNCISWRNQVSVIGDRSERYPRDAAPEVPATTYSLTETLMVGEGNISKDPLFKAPATADYSLTLGSPAIDAGDPATTRDPNGTRADMGYRVMGGVNVPQAPVIVTQPVGGTAFYGDTFIFRVKATGDPILTYQWRRNGENVVGGTAVLDVSTFAGSPGELGSNDGAGSEARFNALEKLVVDAGGNIFVAESNSHTIRKVTPDGVVSTFAGTPGISGSTDGTVANAQFNAPSGVAVDAAGTLYVADTGNHTIRKITRSGVVSTIAGSAGVSGSINGTGSAARFNKPTALCVDGSGALCVVDQVNHVIRKVTAGGVVTTLAGTAGTPGSTDGTGTGARFNFPNDIVMDKSGSMYVADTRNHLIRKVSATGVVTTLAGTAGGAGSLDGLGKAAKFNRPSGLAVDATGNVFVADLFNDLVRKVTPGGLVSTYAGRVGEMGSTDGGTAVAQFSSPVDVAVDGEGNVFVADADNYTIRKISVDLSTTGKGPVYKLVNVQDPDSAEYDVVVTNAYGVAISMKVNLKVLDRKPNIITQPLGGTAFVGGSYSMSVVATGQPTLVYQWRKSGGNLAANDVSLNLSQLKLTDAGEYDVVVSNTLGVVTSTKANLKVVYPLPVITVQPIGNGTLTGGSVALSAEVIASGTVTYQWYKDGLPLPNASTLRLALGEMKPWLIGDYTLKVSNETGSVLSRAAALGMAGENPGIWKGLEAYYLMTGTSGTVPGLYAEYFSDTRLSSPAFTRLDPNIDFNWGSGAPSSKLGDAFSTRWSGTLTPPVSGLYTFYASSDDGVRVWINGQQIINDTTVHPVYEFQGTIQLVAGQSVPVKVEYVESGGVAVCRLSWSAPGLAKQIIPGSCFGADPVQAGIPVEDTSPFHIDGTARNGASFGPDRRKSRDLQLTLNLPHQPVPIPGTNVSFAKYETTVKQWKEFIAATGRSWTPPTFAQTDQHPVVNVSKSDAEAYCDWMSQRTGRVYRLPTTAEWAVVAGHESNPWGASEKPSSKDGNYSYVDDGWSYTAPVGSYQPNALGLYDIGGNVNEWMFDNVGVGWEWLGTMVARGASWKNLDFGVSWSWFGWGNVLSEGQSSTMIDDGTGFRVVVENLPNPRYEIITGSFTSFQAAASDAVRRGGHLVTITSDVERDDVERQLYRSKPSGWWPLTPLLGGVKKVANAGQDRTFEWITGEAFSFSDWMKGYWNGVVILAGTEQSQPPVQPESYLFYGSPRPATGQTGRWVEDSLAAGKTIDSYIIEYEGSNSLPVSGAANTYAIIPGIFGSFASAKADAEARRGHLATITSAEEFAEVKRQVGPNLAAGLFLGAYKDSATGSPNTGWKWVTGEPFSFANWRGGEPNNYDGMERFLEMYTDWTWNDLGEKWFKGNGPAGYLIEFESSKASDLGSLASGTAGVSLPDSPLLYKARTFSLWAKLDSYAFGQLLFHGDTRAGYDPVSIGVDASGRIGFGSNMPAPNAFSTLLPDPLQTGVWYHLAGTVDDSGGIASFYLNGKLVWSGKANPSLEFSLDPNQDAGWGIGNYSGVTQTMANTPFKGSIDDVRFYNRVLNSTEIGQLFQYEAPSRTPLITVQPLAGTVGVLGRFDLSVTAVGEDLQYQWRKNGVNISGGINTSFSISSVTLADEGVYDVVVSNGFGSEISTGALLTIPTALPPANPAPGPSPFDSVIYVSKAGNDSTGTGTYWSPYLTLGKAVSAAPSGYRILVGAGSYSERVEFGGKTLRIHSLSGPALTTIQGVPGRSTIVIDGKNSELRGFRVTGGTGDAYVNASKNERRGGALICTVDANITDCIFDKNGKGSSAAASVNYGGAICVAGGNLSVSNCLFVDNYAMGGAGASYADGGGGAVFVQDGSVTLDRCTVFRNGSSTENLGSQFALAAAANGKLIIRNSILFGNAGLAYGAVRGFGASVSISVEYSDVQGTLLANGAQTFVSVAGNLSVDPQFVETTKLEFALKAGSPAIDAGSPRAPLDPDGSRADMGWRFDRYGVETLLYVATGGNDSTGNGSQGKPYRSISKAIAAAPSGARILVGPGLYAERIDYSGKTLRIHSLMGPEMTTIRGTLGDATVTIDAGSSYSELKGFRVTGGQGRLLLADGQTSLYYGGGIYCGVTAFIADCIVTENGFGRGAMDSCAYGGGVSVRGAFVTLLNCLIYNNFSRMGGGAVCVFDGGIEMDRCTVSRNEIAVGGAQAGIGIGFGGRVELRNSIIWGNSGGAVGRISTSGTGNTEFFSEYSIIEGGLQGDEAELFRRGFGNLDRDPLFVDAARFIFIVSPQSPAKDAAAPGLPYDEDGTPADIGWRAGRYGSGVEIIVNKSGSDSAGNGTLAQPYLTISKAISVAPNGAWISVGPGTYTERVQITGKTLGIRSLTGPGTTTIQGTAGNAVVSIETSAENSRVQGFRITGGTGKPYPSSYGYDYYGGGVYCVASAVLSDCIIDGNGKGTPRLNSATFGGAIYSGGGKLSVLNCLITGNYAWASGGATLTESGTIEFDRCTVQGNDATTFVGQQGGLSVANGGRMIVKNSIVYGNTGSQLGAFGAPYNVNTSISVEYSDVQGTIDGGGTPNLVKGLGNIGADPLFVSVTTKDFSLKTGSPAIDAANPNAPKDVDGTRADMGWRQDRYYVGSAVRKAPDLAVNIAPGNGTRVLLPLDSPVVLISGTVTHDTGVDAVIFTRTLGGVSQSTVLDVMEKPAVLQGSKLVRVWEWRIELPFENFGRCDYSAYAVDQSNLKSIAVSGNFTVAQGARVTLVAPPVNAGTVTVAPAIPADTLVPLGTSLQIIATPKAGYLFRVLEVDVDGLPENDITRSNVTLTISADTTITPQFIVNPFPALVGSWSGLLEDGWTSGLVSVNMTRTGAFTLRVVSGRNSFSVSGIMDASGRARIAVPASFWPYSETKNASNTPNSTALNPLAATLNLVGGKLRFTWGNGDPASAAYGSADLDQAALATAVSKLPSRRYTAALWRSTGSSTAAYDRTAGFFTADLSTSATALAVGVAKVSDKVLRFSFSGNLVSNGTLGTAAASESWNDMTSGLCLNYYAVTSSTDLVVHGAFGLNASELRGPLSSRRIRTGALDPLADAAVQTLSANEMDFRINGFPYVAPKTGQAPLPFVSPGTLSFEVWCSSLSAGTLAWTNSRPVFQASPGAVSAAAGLALRTASVVPLITNGAFSGSIQTLATGSSTTVSNRSLSGVLLQGGTQAGVGLTSDGLPILIQRRGLANDSSAAMVFVAAGVLPSTSLMGAASVSSFYIGRTEVTWGEWKTVRSWALSNGYSDLANVGAGTGDNYPVTDVSWYDVVKWCNARSQKEGKTPVYSLNGVVYKTGQLEPDASVSANGYRLPTEVEWEWAARGGRQTHGYSYSGSNDLNLVGWNVDNSGGSTHEVGKKAANEIGIFDMSGNVWEWCESWYSRSEVSSRVLRGGAWGNCGPAYCTVAFRLAFKPEIRDSIYVGFRVACSAVQ